MCAGGGIRWSVSRCIGVVDEIVEFIHEFRIDCIGIFGVLKEGVDYVFGLYFFGRYEFAEDLLDGFHHVGGVHFEILGEFVDELVI